MIKGTGLFLKVGDHDYFCGSPFPGTSILQIRRTVLGDININETSRLRYLLQNSWST